ncbi:hypothetical protein F511_30207 [Dorcoceras hygrometricum]|uniref:Uncharacterized protein n=1 Tax=Dorcoceras hygrometricum TaxID=472368 RepID=A0A2Z7BZE8_9LAMI|nr:hypothetical protein F511_30207 [Dorcoceras hygrometricum]
MCPDNKYRSKSHQAARYRPGQRRRGTVGRTEVSLPTAAIRSTVRTTVCICPRSDNMNIRYRIAEGDRGRYSAAIDRLKILCCYYEVQYLWFLNIKNRAPETDLFGLQCPTSPLLPPRKVSLEDLIYTSCTDPIPQPAAARTPRLYHPSAVTHFFYAYVRKATNTDFNVIVLGRDLICIGFEIHSLYNECE